MYIISIISGLVCLKPTHLRVTGVQDSTAFHAGWLRTSRLCTSMYVGSYPLITSHHRAPTRPTYPEQGNKPAGASQPQPT
ncbi:hypothetical protein F4805DRAFT_164397 [Annulohypoxylon moriforme]|nr:hypothetical protein F4805DRAFT_164397 [Annulohypoxylon moriforme]